MLPRETKRSDLEEPSNKTGDPSPFNYSLTLGTLAPSFNPQAPPDIRGAVFAPGTSHHKAVGP